MMAQLIDRKALKAQMKDLLRTAQVSAVGMTALYLLLSLVLNTADSLVGVSTWDPLHSVGSSVFLGLFVSILTWMMSLVLGAGYVLYCMAVRRGERAEYITLFDGFSLVGRIIGLNIVMYIFIALWSMLFVIPGIIASYRYRFALYNLLENPDMGIMEALNRSKEQTYGYKGQLFLLDLSYLGWGLLALLPALAINYSVTAQSVSSLLTNTQAVYTGLASLSTEVSTLVCGLWSTLVSLFYLPVYQCTDIGYYEIAKQTSAGGRDTGSSWNGWDQDRGPDGLGGL